MSLKAIIFDFDGLLVDTEWPAFVAWSAIYKEHGAVLDLSVWVACVGTQGGFDPAVHLSQLTGNVLQSDLLFLDKEKRKKEICDQLPFMPGALELFEQARGKQLKLAVASSSDQKWVHHHLKRLNHLHLFDVVVTKDDVARVKPDPELYLLAAQKLGVEPANCLVFEDSLNGVKAAKAAGMYCLGVPNRVTGILDFSLADGKVGSLCEIKLEELMARFWFKG
jgi:HAD superfamily hydrolase (TIGR01509 family)